MKTPWVDRFIAAKLHGDAEMMRKARICANIALIMILICSIFIPLQLFVLKRPVIVALLTVMLCSVGYGLFLVRSQGRVALAGHIIGGTITLSLIPITFLTGGADSSAVSWILLPAPFVFMISGRRPALVWLTLIVLYMAVLFGMLLMGYAAPTTQATAFKPFLQIISLAGSATTLFFVIKIFEDAKTAALETAAQAQSGVEASAKRMESLIHDLDAQKHVAESASQRAEEQRLYLAASIDEMLVEMRRVADGDLTVVMRSANTQANADAIGQLARQINDAVSNIRATVESVYDSVAVTTEVSREISSSTEHVMKTMQHQAQQTHQISSAVEEMARTIEENTQSSARAAHEAAEASDEARRGGSIVQETISGMKTIADAVIASVQTIEALGTSSEQIGEIAQTIEEIADQTNLLALNAAIEAARAGDAGRGFAVVADEVRKLAERTQKATKEIGVMLKKIQTDTTHAVQSMHEGRDRVERGTESAARAASALQTIIDQTSHVADLISQVAAASEQQAVTSGHIAENMETISGATNETVTGMKNIAQNSANLSYATQMLQQAVGRFNVQQNTPHHITHKSKSV